MKSSRRSDPALPGSSSHGSRPLWIIAIACLLVTLLAILLPRPKTTPSNGATATNATPLLNARLKEGARKSSARRGLHSAPEPSPVKTAEEIVGDKVSQFGRNRREIVRAIGRRLHKDVPPEVEEFFDAIEAGNWEEIHSRWQALAKQSGQYESSTHSPDLDSFWPFVLDAYGVAEQAHEWPAQKLLDYGNTVLGSLRPGMVYVGGTDNGRWIPELLNETSGSEPHIIVTQNAFADARYLDYMKELYGDRLTTLTQEDSQRAFQEYLTDAQKRLQHDQQFPDEPKQVRPGEKITDTDGRIGVSGQVAVMAINEKLLQALMEKNPDLSFAMQESFPMKGTYADAVPLGPLMELRAQDAQNTFTAERAAQALDFWRTTAENVLADPEAAGSTAALKSYSHDANSAANLLAARNYSAEAEQAYRLSSQLWPENPEAVGGLAAIFDRTGRTDEARQLLDDFARSYPDQRSAIETFRASILWTAPSAKPSP
jgi:hypothetical protein